MIPPSRGGRALGALLRTAADATDGKRRQVAAANGSEWKLAERVHLAALWNWATQAERAYADRSPFSGRPEKLKKTKERGRDRRFAPGKEQALPDHAGPDLTDVIVTALEAGLRKGEILSLQWKHVRWLQNEIAIAWENTKTKQAREIPISPTLREILARRQKAHPTDKPRSPEHYVFGNEVGDRIKDIRAAWLATVLRVNGVTATDGTAGKLSAVSRAMLGRSI
jgi:integrase